jgi:hypothetical protein
MLALCCLVFGLPPLLLLLLLLLLVCFWVLPLQTYQVSVLCV